MKRYVLGAVALCGLCANSNGQVFHTDFESSAYVVGTDVAGTDGWYLPTTANSVTGIVISYLSNPWSIPGTSRTGAKGAANSNPGGVLNTRMQRDFNFQEGRSYTMTWDATVRYTGTLPGTQNVGSVSLQDSLLQRFFIALMVWTDVTTCTSWAQQYNVVDAANLALNNQSPGAAWTNLQLNRVYRNSVTWNNATNLIERVTICDLATSTFSSFNPTGWYLTGGTTPTLPVATGIRLFVGGTTAGNTVAYDNVSVATKENEIESVSVSAGTPFGGNVASLHDEDGNRLIVLNDENDSTGQVDCVATASQASASWILLRVVASASRNDLSTFVRMKNQANSTYHDVAFAISKLSNSDIVAQPASPGQYVHGGTAQVDLRILWIPTADIDAGDGWTESIDEISLHVSP